MFGTGNAYQVSLCADSSSLTPHQPQDPAPCGMCVFVCLCGEGRDNCMSVCERVCLCMRVNEIERWGDKLYEINYSDQPCLREKKRETMVG